MLKRPIQVSGGNRAFLLGAATVLLFWGISGYVKRRNSPAKANTYRFPTAELAALDWVVQRRFAVNPTEDFGASRIGTRHEYFKSETPAESDVLRQLRRQKQQVVFYVVGRLAALRIPNRMGPTTIQGPIYIAGGEYPKVITERPIGEVGGTRFLTDAGVPAEFPNEIELTKLGKRLITEEKLTGGVSGIMGDWHVEAVPVVASSQSCVNCHNSKMFVRRYKGLIRPTEYDVVQLGDSLGVAVYCYRREPAKDGGR